MSTVEELTSRALADSGRQADGASAGVGQEVRAAGVGGLVGDRQYPMGQVLRVVLVTVLVALSLIAQRNYKHALWLREQTLQKELGDLRSESVVVGAELMQMGQESRVKARVAEQGIPLQSPEGPAMVIELVE